ncbi:MAG TPA: CAP domain-containing protein [Aggregatilineales bacterium]|nr:CAP domain-containing protein [Aggregatilineales bacterium]
MRKLELVALLVLTMTSLTAPAIVSAQGDDNAWMLAQINAYRQRCGVGPVVVNGQLAAAALRHANWMANSWVSGSVHVETNGSTPASRAAAAGYPGRVGENVVGGQTATKEWGFNWWVNSPVHRQNMCEEWTEIGVASADGINGRWFVTDFGVRDGAPTLAPANGQLSATSIIPRPVRPATRVPTDTPTITLTPSITYTPIATFTASSTPTAPPPTGTAIVLAISPQPSDTPVAPTAAAANVHPVAMVQSPLPMETPPAVASADTGLTLRSLIPVGIVLQVVIVGGLVLNTVMRRRR